MTKLKNNLFHMLAHEIHTPNFARFMFKDNINRFAQKVQSGQYQKGVITTHHKPDGDAMGASLGLYHLLKIFIPQLTVVTPTDYAESLNWLPGNDKVVIFEDHTAQAIQLVNEADVIICTDFNALHRINELGDWVRKSSAEKVMIDHHREPENFEDYSFWDVGASSSCELVYRMIKKDFPAVKISPEIAAPLYTGIMTDTGNFSQINTTPIAHEAAAELMLSGANHVDIHERIFNVFSINRSKLFGYCLYEKLEILDDGKTALIALSKEELERFHVVTGDTEGLVNFGLNIEGIVLSVLIIDRTKLVKMSFRSKGNFAVNEFAAKYFEGGGHKNAAGGQSTESLENTVARFKETISHYRNELMNN